MFLMRSTDEYLLGGNLFSFVWGSCSLYFLLLAWKHFPYPVLLPHGRGSVSVIAQPKPRLFEHFFSYWDKRNRGHRFFNIVLSINVRYFQPLYHISCALIVDHVNAPLCTLQDSHSNLQVTNCVRMERRILIPPPPLSRIIVSAWFRWWLTFLPHICAPSMVKSTTWF